jgi:catechol 2,3-dioxygenase-like lactoylglutathione lyase family enzyme
MSFKAHSIIPIVRIFSVEKARQFYVDYLGCKVDWEHRFDESAPLYFQVSRGGLVLHLSEHHGDGSPGTSFKVNVTGVRELHAELAAKKYGYWRPGLHETFYGMLQLKMLDPFGNQLFLEEPLAQQGDKQNPDPQPDGTA